MRVAVCMYGQPRSWAKCVQWQKKNFQSNGTIQFDFFCEVKNYNTDKFTGRVQSVDSTELSALFNAYEPRLSRINTQAYEGIGAFSNTFLGMFGSLLLKQQYEANTNYSYDITVLLRYDVLVGPSSEWFFHKFSSPVAASHIFVPGARTSFGPEAYRIGTSDLLVVGDSLAMDSFGSKMVSNFNPGSDILKSYDQNLLCPNVVFFKYASELGLVVSDLRLSPIIIRDHTEVPSDISAQWHLLHQQHMQNTTVPLI